MFDQHPPYPLPPRVGVSTFFEGGGRLRKRVVGLVTEESGRKHDKRAQIHTWVLHIPLLSAFFANTKVELSPFYF